MTEQIKLRRDTASHFATNAPVLGQAEPALTTDDQGTGAARLKLGDGVTGWAGLPYLEMISDGSVVGAIPVPSASLSNLKTMATLTNGAATTSLSLLNFVPPLQTGQIILVDDGAGHIQEFTVNGSYPNGGQGITGTPFVVNVTSATVTLNTGTNYNVTIGGVSFSIGFGAPNNNYADNRSVYINLLGTTNGSSGSGFNTIYIKRANLWVGIV